MHSPIQIEAIELINKNLSLLQSGSTVTIDITTPAGKKGKFRTCFIGYLPKNYVLIQFPDASKVGAFSQYIKQGVSITVRGLIEGHEGAIVAFVSAIRQTLQTPSRLMVLEFPHKVTLQHLRTKLRIGASIKVKVGVAKEYFQGEISNLSVTGAQVLVHNAMTLMMANDKPIEVVIEDFSALGNLKLKGIVCNVKKQSNDVSLGIRFDDTEQPSVFEVMQGVIKGED